MEEKIAAIISTYNEEQRIRYILESVKNFDDIIIFDKGSTDKTLKIAEEYGTHIYNIPYSDDKTSKEYLKIWELAMKESKCEWLLLLTCSDVLPVELYHKMIEYINLNDVDVVEVPFYRYSMGFCSKYSFYGDYEYKDILVKKSVFINDMDIHVMTKCKEGSKMGRLEIEDHSIAVYHLTHENLQLIIERHLRYAKDEAAYYLNRKEGLKVAWHELLRQVYRYFKLKTYKLGEKGKAQLCMLLLYRSAKYLDIYFDKEKEDEIAEIYNKIRKSVLKAE